MSDLTTAPRTAARAATPLVRSPFRATRCECHRCHAHALLVPRVIGITKCRVCGSYDLTIVED